MKFNLATGTFCRLLLLLSVYQPVNPNVSAQTRRLGLSIPAKFSISVEDFLLIPVSVNGKQFWCDLDSGGSSVFSLDANKAAAAGFKADGTGESAGAGPRVIRDQRMHGATVRIGDVTLPPRTIVMRPFPSEVPEVDCVMGVSLLQDYVVEFDYVTPEVRLLDTKLFNRDSKAFSVPFRIERSNPIADVTFVFDDDRRVTASVILDTGAAYYSAALTKNFVQKNNIQPSRAATAEPSHRSDDDLRVLAARPVRIEVGPVTVSRPVVALLESESAGLPWDGVLGAGFFRQFTAAFDYSRKELLLTPNAHFSQRQSFDTSGLGVRKDAETGEYIVNLVLAGTPAAMADLREGDMLLSIDGAQTRALTPVEVRRLLSRSGVFCVLTVRRDGVVHLLQMELRDRL